MNEKLNVVMVWTVHLCWWVRSRTIGSYKICHVLCSLFTILRLWSERVKT